MKYLCLLLLVTIGLSQARQYSRTVTYEDELVVQCTRLTEEKLQALLDEPSVDVWKVDGEGRLDIRMSWELYERLGWEECTVLHESVEELVMTFEKQLFNQSKPEADWFEEFHTYEEIVNWYKELTVNNEDIIKYYSIGKSYEGRDQLAVHISYKLDVTVPQTYFQCQIHGRDWISGVICMYIANYLVQNKEDNRVSDLLLKYNFVFVPFVNPDGYVYTWTKDRLWKKNRRVNPDQNITCDGVDLDRNYNYHWAKGGSSSNPCSETYHGVNAESEPETQNTANHVRSLGLVYGAIDWQSYGQRILRPYGWTKDNCSDEAQLEAFGRNMSEAIQAVHGKNYTSQKSSDIYKTTGTASDWFYSGHSVNKQEDVRPAGYTIELRPGSNSQCGFLLPSSEFIPNGEEIVAAVLTFAEYLYKNPLNK